MLADTTTIKRSGPLPRLCLIGLSLVALLALARIVQKTASPIGGIGFHCYWYQGHALRQRMNPYQPPFKREAIQLPVEYLDGVVIRDLPIAQSGLTQVPVNTAPLALILFQFSRVSWPVAKWLWALINLGLAVLVPQLVIRSFPHPQSFTRTEELLIHLAFYGLVSTRVAVWVGQTTLVVFTLMLATILLRERHWLLAGICLGLALSKYSLALPVFLFLLFQLKRRDLLIAATALLVQLAGLLVISVWTGDAPLHVAQDYFDIFWHIAGSTMRHGMQLAAVAPQGSGLVFAGLLIVLVCGGFLAFWLWRRARWAGAVVPLAEYHLLLMLVLWTLLVAYHGVYDVLMAILFLPLGLCASRDPTSWRLSPWQRQFLSGVVVLFVGVLILPGPSIVGTVLSPSTTETWLKLQKRGVTLALLLVLAVSSWLLMRLRRFPRR